MCKRKWPFFIGGVLAGAAVTASWRIYGQRTLERIPTPQGIEDPALARGYDRIARLPQMTLLHALVARRAIGLCARGTALDLGCGTGLLAIHMACRAPDLHITGVDLAAEMLAQARENAARAACSKQITFRLGDATAIPCESGSRDLVVSTLSLHHWADPVAVLNEVERVLRPGGAYLLFDLRRDLLPPFYLLLWFVTRAIVPAELRRANEPLASRNAAYTPYEAAKLMATSRLTGWRIHAGPLWLMIEGRKEG